MNQRHIYPQGYGFGVKLQGWGRKAEGLVQLGLSENGLQFGRAGREVHSEDGEGLLRVSSCPTLSSMCPFLSPFCLSVLLTLESFFLNNLMTATSGFGLLFCPYILSSAFTRRLPSLSLPPRKKRASARNLTDYYLWLFIVLLSGSQYCSKQVSFPQRTKWFSSTEWVVSVLSTWRKTYFTQKTASVVKAQMGNNLVIQK